MTAQTILPANSASSGSYQVDNSVRFDDGDSAYMTKTPSGAGNRDRWTFSTWTKRGNLSGEYQTIISTSGDSADDTDYLYFNADNTLHVHLVVSGSAYGTLYTNRKFTDVSAWYHIILVYDSGNGTAGDRLIMYINGVRETSFSASSFPDQNADSVMTLGSGGIDVGRDGSSSGSGFLDGYLAETVLIDGLALDPTSFGEFDDSGIWKPIDVSGLTFGTNGFYLDYKDSSNLGNDANGGTDFGETNLAATDQSTDTCTNNACTLNTLYRSGATFTQGNLVYQAPGSNPVFGALTTFGVSAGKWYAECKYHAGSNHYGVLGVADEVFATLTDLGSATNTDLGKTGAALGSHPNTCTVAYVINTGKIRNNNNNQNYGSGGGDGDIINIALDRDNRKVYFGINGTYENSGDPAAGSNGFDISGQVTGNEYFLGVTNDTGASETILDFNFGGGFGQTAVSTANADANDHGNFEYAVPSGFFAWNTKNLAEYG
jgi:hypothetical protein